MPAALPVIDTSAALCCAPLGSGDFDLAGDAEAVAARLRALADANRIRIIQELSCCEGHEITTTTAAASLQVSEGTANHHLKQLERAGLLATRRDGARVHYRLDLPALRAIGIALQARCGAHCC